MRPCLNTYTCKLQEEDGNLIIAAMLLLERKSATNPGAIPLSLRSLNSGYPITETDMTTVSLLALPSFPVFFYYGTETHGLEVFPDTVTPTFGRAKFLYCVFFLAAVAHATDIPVGATSLSKSNVFRPKRTCDESTVITVA